VILPKLLLKLGKLNPPKKLYVKFCETNYLAQIDEHGNSTTCLIEGDNEMNNYYTIKLMRKFTNLRKNIYPY